MKKVIVSAAWLLSFGPALAAGQAGAAGQLFIQKGAGAVPQRLTDKLAQNFNTIDFGAVCNDTVNDTAAIQRTFDAAPVGGTVHIQQGRCRITAPIRITKSVRIVGAGQGPYSLASDVGKGFAGSMIHQVTAGKNAFTLVPQATGNAYRWAYGLTDVQFEALNIQGPSAGTKGGSGIGTDTSVNGGDFHLRQNTFRDLNIKYFENAVELTGIAYLNNFYQVSVSYSTTGIRIARGKASDEGGQTRFFGITGVATDTVLSLNEDSVGGSFSVFGSTLSESKYGIRTNEEALLTVVGSELEALKNGGNGAGIYIPMKESNPNTQGTKTIIGNKFLGSDADIWINKTSSAFAGGGYYWPVLIDSNYFGSERAVRLDVPAGSVGFDSPAFVFGASNSGLNSGQVADAQLSANFMGTDARKRRITRRWTFTGTTPSGALVASLPAGMVLQTVRVYLTARNAGFTSLQIGNQSSGSKYIQFDAGSQAQPLNAWVSYNSPTGDVLTSRTNQLKLSFTAGNRGAAGVIEYDGYIP